MSEYCKYKNKRVNKDWLYNNKPCLNHFNQIESIPSGGLNRHVYVSWMVLK